MNLLLGERCPQLTLAQRDKLVALYELLLAGNERMNLTALVEPQDVADKHFVDSLLGEAHIPQGACCIDVGAGAGFPGIPLMIVRPDIRMTLLDSVFKRVAFLRETCAALGLEAECVHARAEDAAKLPAYRGKYDIALARAVAQLPLLLELTVPFVRVGGAVLAYKGKQAAEEAALAQNACRELNCTLTILEKDTDYGERAIVQAVKNAPTPLRYPRKAGIPERKPL